jgi:hypothetical protein
VLPKEGVTKESWYPNLESRYGMAYGFDDLEFAANTHALLVEKVQKDHEENATRVSVFLQETHDFFN